MLNPSENKICILLGLIAIMTGCMGGEGDTATTFTNTKVQPLPKTMIFYMENGAPASNAEVIIVPVENMPGTGDSGTFTTRTDAEGRYSIATLSSGLYNLFATILVDTNTEGVFLDSVDIKKYFNSIPAITLRATGGVVGWIQLRPGQHTAPMFVSIKGSNRTISVNSHGEFYGTQLAPGRYTFVVNTYETGYLPGSTTFIVRSGKQDTLRDTLKPIFIGRPTVTGLKVQYDTGTGLAHISWDKLDWNPMKFYRLYRGVGSGEPIPILNNRDTQYTDTLLLIDKERGRIIDYGDKDDNLIWKVQYSITSVDTSGVEGPQLDPIYIDVPSPFYIRTTIINRVFSRYSNERVEDNIHAGDSVRIEITFGNLTRKTKKVQWFYRGEVDSLFKEAILDTPSLYGTVSAWYKARDVAGTDGISILVWDDAGSPWKDTLNLQIKEKISIGP